MRWTFRTVVTVCFVITGMAVGMFDPASAQTPPPNPCSLLSRAEMQKVTGNADAMAYPNQADKTAAGAICTIDGGGKNNLDFEFRLYTRTKRVPLNTPPKAEPLTGIGEGAYFMATPGNALVTAIKGDYLLNVGAQSKDTTEALKAVTIAVARAAVAKLP